MNDAITKEQVLNAYNNAPDLVRATFNDEKTTQVIVGLQTKFQLHVDNTGVLAKEVGYLLLGLIDPNKFIDRLKNNDFPEQMCIEIVNEINQKIFVPLREKMKSGEVATQPPPIRVVPPSTPINDQVPRYSPPPTPPLPPPPPPRPTPPPPPPPPPTKRPPFVSLNSARLLEDHEEPHIELNKAAAPFLREEETPLRQALRAAIPPTDLPGALPPRPVLEPKPIPPTPPPHVPPQIPIIPPISPIAPTPPAHSRPYSVDPYHEPIDIP